jgi:hypothetical protein
MKKICQTNFYTITASVYPKMYWLQRRSADLRSQFCIKGHLLTLDNVGAPTLSSSYFGMHRLCTATASELRRGNEHNGTWKVVTSEKIGWSGVASTLVTWYEGVVMGVLLSFDEAAILYRDFNSAPSQKRNILVFAANNSMCCECHVAPTILL